MRRHFVFHQLGEGFILDCKSRNLSNVTKERDYAPVLCDVFDWLEIPLLEEITTEKLRRFFFHFRTATSYSSSHLWMKETSEPLSAWTMQRYHRVTWSLFTWVIQEGILTANPADGLRPPETPTKVTIKRNRANPVAPNTPTRDIPEQRELPPQD